MMNILLALFFMAFVFPLICHVLASILAFFLTITQSRRSIDDVEVSKNPYYLPT